MDKDRGQAKLGMGEGRSEKRCVRDLTPGSSVAREQFAVQSKRLSDFKNKPGQYMSLTLSDSTGEIQARVWDNAEALAATFEEGDVVAVTGRVEAYREQKQLILTEVVKCAPEEVRREDFLPQAERSPEEMFDELTGVCKSVRDPGLRKLLAAFFADAEFGARFRSAPGAMRIHHAYVGGLIEHSLNVARICDHLCGVYPKIDRDLLVAGALLHDIGKVYEYVCDTTIETTVEGDLIGHVVVGYRLLTEAMRGVPELGAEVRMRLGHLMVAHHGEPEFGAAKRPMTPEAIALHFAENLDAKVNQVLGVVEREGAQGKNWSEYVKSLERKLFIGEAATTADE